MYVNGSLGKTFRRIYLLGLQRPADRAQNYQVLVPFTQLKTLLARMTFGFEHSLRMPEIRARNVASTCALAAL